MLKKIEGQSGQKGETRKEEIVSAVSSLRPKYPLNLLLTISRLSR